MKTYKPCIVVLSGIPLVGKTTLGKVLSEHSNLVFCDVETARKQVEASGAWLREEKEKEIMLAAYKLNHQWVKKRIEEGVPVLITATYSRPIYHEMLRVLQKETNVPLKVFLLTCLPELLRQRVSERTEDNPSNLRTVEQLQTVLDRYVPYPEITKTIDTTRLMEECVQEIFDPLHDVQKINNV